MKKISRRFICIGLATMLFVGMLLTYVPVHAEDNGSYSKDYTTHDIAIVFDNSGSMYENESWCQALYSIEVFATMVDYDHDKLGKR